MGSSVFLRGSLALQNAPRPGHRGAGVEARGEACPCGPAQAAKKRRQKFQSRGMTALLNCSGMHDRMQGAPAGGPSFEAGAWRSFTVHDASSITASLRRPRQRPAFGQAAGGIGGVVDPSQDEVAQFDENPTCKSFNKQYRAKGLRRPLLLLGKPRPLKFMRCR